MRRLDIVEKNMAAAAPQLPEFQPGDTLKVRLKVKEGTRERIQTFEGVCIGRKNAGVNSSFTVRKISYGEGVERVFPANSPMIDGVEVVRRGIVRRSKLYYLRDLSGKAARITERRGITGLQVSAIEPTEADIAEAVAAAPAEAAPKKAKKERSAAAAE